MIRKLFLLIILIYCAVNAAADSVTLTMQQAWDYAVENNAEIRRQQIVLSACRRNLEKSWNGKIPELSVSASDSFSANAVETENEVTISGNASLSLKSDYFLSKEKRKLEYEIEKMNYDQICSRVHKDVSDFFFDILSLEYEIRFRTESLENSQNLYKENQGKYKKGFLSENDLLMSRITYEKQRDELGKIKNGLRSTSVSFCILLGLPPDTEIELSADLPVLYEIYKVRFNISFRQELDEMIQKNSFPEIMLLELQKQAAEKNLKGEKQDGWGPTFDFSYSITPNFDNRKMTNVATAGITIPLNNAFSSSQSRERVRKAEDAVHDYEIQIADKMQSAPGRINNLLSDLEQLVENVQTYKSFTEITERNRQLCQSSYSNGVIDFQSVRNAAKEHLDTQIEYIGCMVKVLKAYSSIEQMTGMTIR